MNVLYYDLKTNVKAEQKVKAKKKSLKELLINSDIVSLHLPCNKNTKNIMNKNTFSLMKPTSIFINTSSGDLIDQKALYEVLNANSIFGAGLDTTNPEPLDIDH